MNDMKSYLQDFLAIIQRTLQGKSKNLFLDDTLNKLGHQLLEYRYLFGQFFTTIMIKKLERVQLRNQFIFVDQYFESMENLLQKTKSA
jgi:hypothetical protein